MASPAANNKKHDGNDRMPPDCDCGTKMQLCFAAKVICNECRSGSVTNPSGHFYHCPNAWSLKHPMGYDLCQKCGNEKFKEQQRSAVVTVSRAVFERLQNDVKRVNRERMYESKQVAALKVHCALRTLYFVAKHMFISNAG